MRSGLYALYEDSEFCAEFLPDGRIRLTTDLSFTGFERSGRGFEKTLNRNELTELFIVSATVEYGGETLIVERIDGDSVIAVANDEKTANILGILPDENGVFCISLNKSQIKNASEHIRMLNVK